MATKSVYQPINESALKLFELEETPLTGVFSYDNKIEDIIEVNLELYTVLCDLLKNSTIDDLSTVKDKKAFLLPLSPVSLNRVKYILSENSIKFTNDYEEADFIITHDDFHKKYYNRNDKILNSALCFTINEGITINSAPDDGTSFLDVYEYLKDTNKKLLMDGRNRRNWNRIFRDLDYYCFTYNNYVTGMMLNIAEKIQNGMLNVIHVKTLMGQSTNKILFTEQLAEDLINQINSNNREDVDMAGMVLPTIDYSKNIHLLWEFSQNYYWTLQKFNRNKDVKEWIERAKLIEYYRNNAEDMILKLKQDENLTKTYFNYFEPLARKQITIHNREIYNFKVSIKPEFLEFNNEDE